ncbi:MAG TPA: response regulator, partial [Bryobacteraceae bacterium]|nr:response regulator [Bryobacteraceae bacterium]
DDDASVREFLRTALRREGYRVVTASTGDNLLAQWHEQLDRIDAMVFDVVIPACRLNELLPVIKVRRPDLKVLLTSDHSEADVRRLYDFGDDVLFIQKPFSVQQFSQKLAALIGRVP